MPPRDNAVELVSAVLGVPVNEIRHGAYMPNSSLG